MKYNLNKCFESLMKEEKKLCIHCYVIFMYNENMYASF